MANVATIVDVDVDVDVCTWRLGGWGRYTYIDYIVPNDWEKVPPRELENWLLCQSHHKCS